MWTDTDYAGCKETRKSTSAGAVYLGRHVVKTWSNTQCVVALSAGEAEYYGMVRGELIGLGRHALLHNLGVTRGVEIKTDASAAKGITTWKGLGKVHHIEASQLRLQRKVARGERCWDD